LCIFRKRIALLDKTVKSATINVVSRRLQSTIVGKGDISDAKFIHADATGIQGIHDGIAAASFNRSSDKKSFFPQRTDKNVAYWLFTTAGLVFGIVILGGLTRLTESGLVVSCLQNYLFIEAWWLYLHVQLNENNLC